MNNTTTHKSSHDTEHDILKAAEKEFLSKGFAGSRTTSIAEAAGVTHAMLHYYFRSKANLFERVLQDKLNLLREALYSSFDYSSASLEEMIRNVIESHLDFIASNPELPRFLIVEIFSDPKKSNVFLDGIKKYAPLIIQTIQKKINAEAAKGNCRNINAGMLMLDIASLNIFSYLAAPAVQAALGDLADNPVEFLEIRKKENFDTIMRKLRP
ncbi:MAG: TetR/AcrR family transcriptional regulator [Muribaculaceae bacterium]|nr:TetR/AcrR family transcriptional regulator [Muribaculaceae bacterium]